MFDSIEQFAAPVCPVRRHRFLQGLLAGITACMVIFYAAGCTTTPPAEPLKAKPPAGAGRHGGGGHGAPHATTAPSTPPATQPASAAIPPPPVAPAATAPKSELTQKENVNFPPSTPSQSAVAPGTTSAGNAASATPSPAVPSPAATPSAPGAAMLVDADKKRESRPANADASMASASPRPRALPPASIKADMSASAAPSPVAAAPRVVPDAPAADPRTTPAPPAAVSAGVPASSGVPASQARSIAASPPAAAASVPVKPAPSVSPAPEAIAPQRRADRPEPVLLGSLFGDPAPPHAKAVPVPAALIAPTATRPAAQPATLSRAASLEMLRGFGASHVAVFSSAHPLGLALPREQALRQIEQSNEAKFVVVPLASSDPAAMQEELDRAASAVPAEWLQSDTADAARRERQARRAAAQDADRAGRERLDASVFGFLLGAQPTTRPAR